MYISSIPASDFLDFMADDSLAEMGILDDLLLLDDSLFLSAMRLLVISLPSKLKKANSKVRLKKTMPMERTVMPMP